MFSDSESDFVALLALALLPLLLERFLLRDLALLLLRDLERLLLRDLPLLLLLERFLLRDLPLLLLLDRLGRDVDLLLAPLLLAADGEGDSTLTRGATGAEEGAQEGAA